MKFTTTCERTKMTMDQYIVNKLKTKIMKHPDDLTSTQATVFLIIALLVALFADNFFNF
jgi:hypothetical protein